MELYIPNQLFVNNEFIDASDGGTFNTISPTDESVICKVAKATKEDVDYAVHCAKVSGCLLLCTLCYPTRILDILLDLTIL